MATPVAVESPYTMKTATVVITPDGGAASDFSNHIGEITLAPTAQSGSWTAISGYVLQDVGKSTWACTLGIIQDLADSGLLRYLMEHEGEKAEVEATLATGADLLTFTVTLSPSTIGGAAGPNPLSGTVTLPVDGTPVFS